MGRPARIRRQPLGTRQLTMHHFFRVMSQLSLLIWAVITALTGWFMFHIRESAFASGRQSDSDIWAHVFAQAGTIYYWSASLGILVGSALFHIAAEITLLRKATENSK